MESNPAVVLMAATDWPLVSIVTPTFNAGPYVDQAIKSIRVQRYKNWEHIVVDGGSTDGTLSILKGYEWQRNFRWTSEPDRGVYDAINKGLRNSNGEILCFLSADDLYLPWTLETVAKSFERESAADIIYGDGIVTAMANRFGIISFNPPSRSLESFCEVATPNTNPFFWKRQVYEELGGYDLTFKVASDYDFLSRASKKFKSAKVNEVLSIWRYRPDSITGNRRQALEEFGRISSRMKRLSSPKTGPLTWRARRARFFLESSYTELLTLLILELSGNERGDWGNLIKSEAISGSRLARDLMTTLLPGLLGRNLGSIFRPGYIDVRRLLRLATSESPH